MKVISKKSWQSDFRIQEAPALWRHIGWINPRPEVLKSTLTDQTPVCSSWKTYRGERDIALPRNKNTTSCYSVATLHGLPPGNQRCISNSGERWRQLRHFPAAEKPQGINSDKNSVCRSYRPTHADVYSPPSICMYHTTSLTDHRLQAYLAF